MRFVLAGNSKTGAGMILKMLVRVFFRSFFIHSFWNDKKMQNVGFCYSVFPAVRYLRLEGKKEADFRKRHLQLFSTHPCFAAAIIGSAVREELSHDQKEGEGDAIAQQKNIFMAPYAALGDPLFSGALKPLCSVVSVCLAFQGLLFAPLVYLMLFNPLNILLRLRFFSEGYKRGNAAFSYIHSLNLPLWTSRLRLITFSIAALLAFMITLSCLDAQTQALGVMKTAVMYGLAMLYVLVCYRLLKVGLSQMTILYSSAGLVLIASWVLC